MYIIKTETTLRIAFSTYCNFKQVHRLGANSFEEWTVLIKVLQSWKFVAHFWQANFLVMYVVPHLGITNLYLFFWISFSLVPVYLLIHCVETSCWLLEEGISALQTHEKSKLDLLKHDHSLKMKSRMGYREQYFNKIHLVSL